MKIKLFILGLSLGAAILGGCNDDLNLVGPSIQPDEDKFTVQTDSFQLQASTIAMDSVYAKTTYGLLGEMYDPLFGNLKSDYICQFYCPENYTFKHKPVNGKIDSMDVEILYMYRNTSWIGDSLAPMRAQVYKVTKPLTRDYYTNINPADYSNMQTSLGMQTYTAYDASIPDSVRFAKDINGNYTFAPQVSVRLPKELGQQFYDETVNNPGTFRNQETFNQFFPGFYITNTFGSGNILYVGGTNFNIYYKYAIKGSAGQDSIIKAQERFVVTKEVIQLNRFKNTDMSHLLVPNNDYTYLKTPAGVYTRLVLPAKEISGIVEGRIINEMPFTMKALPQENWQYALTPPPYLLLLPEDSVKTFFEGNQVENNQTSFLSFEYSASTRAYSFGNIANLLTNQLKNAPEKDLVLVTIPVNRQVGTNNYTGEKYTVSLSNYLVPAGVKLNKSMEAMKIKVTSSKFNNR